MWLFSCTQALYEMLSMRWHGRRELHLFELQDLILDVFSCVFSLHEWMLACEKSKGYDATSPDVCSLALVKRENLLFHSWICSLPILVADILEYLYYHISSNSASYSRLRSQNRSVSLMSGLYKTQSLCSMASNPYVLCLSLNVDKLLLEICPSWSGSIHHQSGVYLISVSKHDIQSNSLWSASWTSWGNSRNLSISRSLWCCRASGPLACRTRLSASQIWGLSCRRSWELHFCRIRDL